MEVHNPLFETVAIGVPGAHDFARLEMVRTDLADEQREAPSSFTIVASEAPLARAPRPFPGASVERPDAAAIRAEVERVLAFYLSIDYFRQRAILPSPDSRRTSSRTVLRQERLGDRVALVPMDGIRARKQTFGSAIPETERGKTLWKSTVAAKLGRVPTAHRRLLLEAAELGDQVRQLRRRVRSLTTALGSPSRRARMSRFDRDRMADAKEIGSAFLEILSRQRSSIRRRTVYDDAARLFYRACSSDPVTREYIFESFLAEQ